ncbi:hypothetical protein MLD38_000607 [Melastoma candidum]|uniref:Uncharacterized protein n=1 Tax=Melastoma candidum TaxID=119954 RepID=A0ACB9SEK7_9MYRT|nr:hypothetical protein MLD38_000607 [Melastoma candidum]
MVFIKAQARGYHAREASYDCHLPQGRHFQSLIPLGLIVRFSLNPSISSPSQELRVCITEDVKCLGISCLTAMHFARKVDEPCKDCFEERDKEAFIFREVVFGNEQKDGGKGQFGSLAAGSTIHEGESCKGIGGSNSSNSEHSTLSSLSCKDLSGSSRRDEDVNVQSQSESSLEALVIPEKFPTIVGEEQTNTSVNVRPDAISTANKNQVSSLPPGSSCRILSTPNETVLPIDKFLVVESSNQGIAYNWYLTQEHMPLKDGAVPQKMGSVDSEFPEDGNFVREAITSRAAASPVSQGSFASRLLATGLPANVQETSGSPLFSEERAPECKDIVLMVPENPLETCSIAECRRLLHQHALEILEAAGWLVTKHKRPCRQAEEYKYKSPGGRSVRELCRAWRICGDMLIGGGSGIMLEEGTKEWDSFGMFFSDVKCALARVESEFTTSVESNALTRRWILLDPFVTVFFIDKKIGALRKGEVVKANWSCAPGNKENATSDWKDKFQNRDPFRGRNLSENGKSDSKVLALCAETSNRASGRRYNRGRCQTTNSSVKLLTGISSDFIEQHSDLNELSPVNTVLHAPGHRNSIVFSERRSHDVWTTAGDPEIEPGETRATSRWNNCKESLPCLDGSGMVLGAGYARGVDEDNSIVTWEMGDEGLDNKNAKHIRKLPTYVQHFSKCHPSLFQTDFSSSKSLRDGSKLVNSDNKSDIRPLSCSPQANGPGRSCFGASDVKQCGDDKMEYVQYAEEDLLSKKKMRRKSKRISEIESTTSSDEGYFRQTSLPGADALDLVVNASLLDHSDEDEHIKGTIKGSKQSDKSLYLLPCNEDVKKKREYKKGPGGTIKMKGRAKRSRKCHIGDNDLLVSVLMQNDEGRPFASQSTPERKAHKPKARRMLKARRDGWRLLPRSWGKASKLLMEKKWSLLGARTVLSWLISAGVISPNDVIQYRDLEDNTVIKDGLITWDGIICKCCSQVLSVSQFKVHSGFRSSNICLNLFMKESGPFSLCALEAWSSEHKTRKNARVAVQVDENDCNDDLCAVCGDDGELICCDNCPATYHQSCLLTKDLPEGNWYCPSCTCRICEELVDDQKPTSSSDAVKCLQCEHKYHRSCLKQRNGNRAVVDGCFCGESCRQVHSVLRSQVGLMNHITDGYSWILLRCFHDDLKFPSAAKFAFKAECNSKLAVALSLMEECFLSMVDPRTGIDMIPHVLYNWGSDFARLNFDNFYTVVLENDDVLIAAASIRVHGVAVAEMPLIATCSKYRRQGMCRRLMTAVEELLISIKVEKLVIAAVPQLIETWTNGFGFQVLEDDEKHSLNKINLMVFPGTVLLKKTLYTKPGVPSAVICCGLEAEGFGAELPSKICCALEAEPTPSEAVVSNSRSSVAVGECRETPIASEDRLVVGLGGGSC